MTISLSLQFWENQNANKIQIESPPWTCPSLSYSTNLVISHMFSIIGNMVEIWPEAKTLIIHIIYLDNAKYILTYSWNWQIQTRS